MTLAEVLVSFVVSGLAISGIVYGYTFTVFSAQRFALSQAATARAMERLEQTMCAQWITSVSPVTDQLVSSNFPNETVTLDICADGTTVVNATNVTTISTISVTPGLRSVHVDCLWVFGPTQKAMTNSVEMIRSAQ